MSAPDSDLPISALSAYLRERGLAVEDLSGDLVSGGRSNLTYAIDGRCDGADVQWILRRPPLGHVLATAHDMAREYRVIDALGPTGVRVPATVLECKDASVLGAPFYLMDRVAGDVLRTDEDLRRSQHDGPALAESLVVSLAALHGVDPESVGLGDFGRWEGFLGRQVRRWTSQLQASRSRELPGIDRLAADLDAGRPDGAGPAVVHGDFRLDNCVVQDSSVVAVLDWEMATLGDWMADLSLFLVYYAGLADIPNSVVHAPAGRHGFPGGSVLVDLYSDAMDVDLADLDWYLAFAWFKLAVILEGIHFRDRQGLTAGEGFSGVAELVPIAVEQGLEALAGRAVLR